MRQSQQKNRMRGRGRKQPNPMSRNYESNGPDVKIRGNAAHIAEKYTSLARDALGSGDTVMAENYLQHAEHYNRIVAAAQANSTRDQDGMAIRGQQPDMGGGYDDDEDDGDDLRMDGGQRQPEIRQGEQRHFRDQREGREFREPREVREPREGREHREPREHRQNRDARPQEPRQAENQSQPQEAGAGQEGEGDRPRREQRPRRRPRGASEEGNGAAANGNGHARESRERAPSLAPGISNDAAKLPGSLLGMGEEHQPGGASDD